METKEPTPDLATEPSTSGPTFDSILLKLQDIVERMESGELSLEDSLKAFEQGVELSRRGQAILDAAEQKVELLLRDGSTMAFDPEKSE